MSEHATEETSFQLRATKMVNITMHKQTVTTDIVKLSNKHCNFSIFFPYYLVYSIYHLLS